MDWILFTLLSVLSVEIFVGTVTKFRLRKKLWEIDGACDQLLTGKEDGEFLG